ncbi:MAG: DUF2846 domain-containing protein [Prolixibacteraceae bacterium]|nr:DUF2846 domain-containing protein [Prolixibacteraceae bacterium]MBN2775420.1 DUF2846 domain-containing protein [Prolixibacteraceae bacterium]
MEKIEIPEGKALVYILRPAFLGKLIKIRVFDDNEHIGYTIGKTYIYAFLSPGSHTLISKAENTSKLQLEVEAGKVYYIEQKVSIGFIKARNRLILINENDGITLKEKCKPSKYMESK